MDVKISGTPKEIAALVVGLQERHQVEERLSVRVSKCDPDNLVVKHDQRAKVERLVAG